MQMAKRDRAAVNRSLNKTMEVNGDLHMVAMCKRGVDNAAITAFNTRRNVPILLRLLKSLNNNVEQDLCAIKPIVEPIMLYKSFHAARSVLTCVELIHVLRMAEFADGRVPIMSFADQFSAATKNSSYSLRGVTAMGKFHRLINIATAPVNEYM
jgi:putative transposase